MYLRRRGKLGSRNLIKRNNYLSISTCKIPKTIRKIGKEGTQINKPMNQEIHDDARSFTSGKWHGYVSWKEERRGREIASIQDCWNETIQGLDEYMEKTKEILNIAACNSLGL